MPIMTVLAAGALSLPLTLGAAGIASADTESTNSSFVQLGVQSQDERGTRDVVLDLDLTNDGQHDGNDRNGLFDRVFDGALSADASADREGTDSGSVQLGAQSQDERGTRDAVLDLDLTNDRPDNQDDGVLNNIL